MFKVVHEIELRGPLNKGQYKSLLHFLKRNGKFIEHRVRLNYMFDHPNKLVDVRIRSTNDNIEMTMKLGHVGAHRRKEITFNLGKVELGDALDFLNHLGYKRGLRGTRISDIFRYRGAEFAVVSVPGVGRWHTYYFEIEGQAKSTADVQKVKKRLLETLRKMDLRIFGMKEYDDYLVDMNKNASERFTLKG